MKYLIFAVLPSACLLLLSSCMHPTEPPIPTKSLTTSLTCTRMSGEECTTFYRYESFYVIFTISNKTGSAIEYSYTGVPSELYISRNETLVVRQFDGVVFPHVIVKDTLRNDSSLVNRWLAPTPLVSSVVTNLDSGVYTIDVNLLAVFNGVLVQLPSKVQIEVLANPIVRKPNLYLYPTTQQRVNVSLEFPMGGTILKSDPLYTNPWVVDVAPNGTINGTYRYLFYECEVPPHYQYTAGWCVARDTLESFFRHNLASYGFREHEIDDFIEYWIPQLKNSPYYLLYPQTSTTINALVRLNITPTPGTVLRLYYVIKESNARVNLPTPTVLSTPRNGFTVVEWGGVVLF